MLWTLTYKQQLLYKRQEPEKFFRGNSERADREEGGGDDEDEDSLSYITLMQWMMMMMFCLGFSLPERGIQSDGKKGSPNSSLFLMLHNGCIGLKLLP